MRWIEGDVAHTSQEPHEFTRCGKPTAGLREARISDRTLLCKVCHTGEAW